MKKERQKGSTKKKKNKHEWANDDDANEHSNKLNKEASALDQLWLWSEHAANVQSKRWRTWRERSVHTALINASAGTLTVYSAWRLPVHHATDHMSSKNRDGSGPQANTRLGRSISQSAGRELKGDVFNELLQLSDGEVEFSSGGIKILTPACRESYYSTPKIQTPRERFKDGDKRNQNAKLFLFIIPLTRSD